MGSRAPNAPLARGQTRLSRGPSRGYFSPVIRPLATPEAGPLRVPADGMDFGLRELVAIREIVHAFLTADRPEDVFQFALDRVSPLVGAAFACVYLVDGASELMKLVAVHNW